MWNDTRQAARPRHAPPPGNPTNQSKEQDHGPRRRGGPWPGWLRWWYAQGGPRRDAIIWDLYLAQLAAGNRRPGQLVADAVGVSRSTVHRALIRYGQRARGEWPPAVPNGFGYGARDWREKRRQALGLSPAQAYAEDKAEAQELGEFWPTVDDQYDDNGDPAW
jgi:hypothetical protein